MHCRLVRGGLLDNGVVVDDVALDVGVEVGVALGVVGELVSVDDDSVPAMDNTSRLDLRTTARLHRARQLQTEHRVTLTTCRHSRPTSDVWRSIDTRRR